MNRLENNTTNNHQEEASVDKAISLVNQNISPDDIRTMSYTLSLEKSKATLSGKIDRANESADAGYKAILSLLEETNKDLKYMTPPKNIEEITTNLLNYKKMIEDINSELSMRVGSSGQNEESLDSSAQELKSPIIKAKTLNIAIAKRARELLSHDKTINELPENDYNILIKFFAQYEGFKTTY